jgi:methyl-accepting chemotaxis protein
VVIAEKRVSAVESRLMKLGNLKISARLSGVLGLQGLLLVLLAVATLFQLSQIQAEVHEITQNWLPSVERVNQMNTGTSDFRITEMQHVMNTDDAKMAAIEQDMARVLAGFEDDHQAYVKLISSDEEQRLYEAFHAQWKQYLQLHEQVLALSRKNENEQARQLLEGSGKTLFDGASAALLKLVDLNHAGAMSATASADAAYARTLQVVWSVVALALALGLVLAVWLVRSITRPLQVAVVALDRVAQGDLTVPIESQAQDETGQLLQALQRMQASLITTVGSVRGNAQSVAIASTQIAQGNGDLSQRTEEQASALEQTAATMDQLGSTVRNNADNAQQAHRMSAQASEVAVQGGAVVGQVVDTMQGINASAKRIADIIAVIDGIAFQTNILALNAAVEAARAGEQGRGFAVVATEVRNLAQRSADAAKEIKSLIIDSVERVERGSVLVGQAGTTMQDVVTAIQKVSDIVGEISSASTEQSAGVAQVGQAIAQMDQVTQQNAALVEESAAAAESLKQQAQQLVQAVSVFRLDAQPGIERRGPHRATHVSRPDFGAKAAARTGTDDWQSF